MHLYALFYGIIDNCLEKSSKASHLHLIDEIDGAAFGFVEDAADVFTDDADTDEVHATEEKDGDHQRGESLNGVTPDDGFDKDIAHV